MHSSTYYDLLKKAGSHLIPEKKIVRRKKGVHEQTYWVRPKQYGGEVLLPKRPTQPVQLVDLWTSALDLYPSLEDFIAAASNPSRREKARLEKIIIGNGKAYLKFRGQWGQPIYTPVFREALQMQPGDEIELPFDRIFYDNTHFPYATGLASLRELRKIKIDMSLRKLLYDKKPLKEETIEFIKRYGTPEQLDLLDLGTNPARKEELFLLNKRDDIEERLSLGEIEMQQNYDASQRAKTIFDDIAKYGTESQKARYKVLRDYVAKHALKHARRLLEKGEDFFNDLPDLLRTAKQMAVTPSQLAEALELEEVYQAQKTSTKKSNRKGK